MDFAIAKSLQKIYDCDLFAIADINNNLKKFLQIQNLVNFHDIWFYRDHISITKKPDLNYLASLEENYKMNIWSIAYFDRLFYPAFNKYYKFNHDEILSIIEQGSKFFENIIDKVKPDFLITYTITAHNTYLLYHMCKMKNVKILTLEPHHFGNKWVISKEVGRVLDVKDYSLTTNSKKRTLEELRSHLNNLKPLVFSEKPNTKYKISKLRKLNAAIKFFLTPTDNMKNQYPYYGRSKINVLFKGNARLNLLKMKLKENFINANFITKIDENERFVYFPLAQEPERRLLMNAPYFTDQIAIITNIAKSMPVGYRVYVKEHPVMKETGWRDISFYERLTNLPNVVLVHPSIKTEEMIKKCSLVITINGTTALESLFYGKPSIVLVSDEGYSLLSSIYNVKTINELPQAIKSSLKKQVNVDELNRYVDLIEKNSFYFDQVDFTSELTKLFNYNIGYQNQEEVNTSRLNSFLNEYDSIFASLASEHLKKIKEYQEKSDNHM